MFSLSPRQALTETQLLQSTIGCLWEHEIDKDDFKGDPSAEDKEIFPGDALDANGVDEGGEEICATSPELEERNSASSLCVWEEFDEICYRTSVPDLNDEAGAREFTYCTSTSCTRCCTLVSMRR